MNKPRQQTIFLNTMPTLNQLDPATRVNYLKDVIRNVTTLRDSIDQTQATIAREAAELKDLIAAGGDPEDEALLAKIGRLQARQSLLPGNKSKAETALPDACTALAKECDMTQRELRSLSEAEIAVEVAAAVQVLRPFAPLRTAANGEKIDAAFSAAPVCR